MFAIGTAVDLMAAAGVNTRTSERSGVTSSRSRLCLSAGGSTREGLAGLRGGEGA